MREPVYTEKIQYFLLEFMNSPTKKTGVLPKDLYKYIYLFFEDNYYVLITSLYYSEAKAFKILEYITHQDPLDVLVAIDNVIFEDTIIFPNLSLIRSMDSQEEKIYNMMMKNKELELRRKQKAMMRPVKKDPVKALVKDVVNRDALKEVKKDTVKRDMLNNEVTSSKKRFETSKSPVFICLKERLRCSVDTENNIKKVEVLGEMTLNIKDEKYKALEIHLVGDYKNCKFSPKLSKDSSSTGVVRSDKPFSLNKNIALLKWKDTTVEKIPIEFTFWPSEIKLNTYQISLEYTTDTPLENLTIYIPKKNLREIHSEDLKDKGDVLEWSVGNSPSDSLEFQCRCADPTDVFPIEVYFTSSHCHRSIEVGEVLCGDQPLDCVEIKKILEVDSFTIEN